MSEVGNKLNFTVPDEEFRKEASLLRSLWVSIKNECDSQEKIVSKEDKIKFVASSEKKYFSLMSKYFLRLNQLVVDLSETKYLEYKKYLRGQLCDLMISEDAPMNKQISDKPFGYAGDYLVANYFYENGYSGLTLWGMLMDRFTVQSPFAVAHRNRRSYLNHHIKMLLKERKGEVLSITSLACGPAQEVFDILEDDVANIEFTLIDGERRAIDFINKKLGKLNLTMKVNVYQENILNLLRRNSELSLPPQDFIYCAGFFDYIKDPTAKKCIKYMFDCLKPGGWLLVLNVAKKDERDVCLKMLADWELYHRNISQLEALVGPSFSIKHKEVWADSETERNIYLFIVKDK